MGIVGHGWVWGLAALLIAGATPAGAGLWDKVQGAVQAVGGGAATGGDASGLGAEEVARGLREALAKGATQAVSRSSAVGGFLDNPKIRIPLPGKLESAAGALRLLGLGSYFDAFEETLNRAAEKAAGEALPIFSDAVTNLSFEDVMGIWKGGDTAATEYLRKATGEKLYERFRPVVKGATEQVGVTRSYRELVGRPEVASLVAGSAFDLDHYATTKALDGVFTLLAEEEKEIRTNPVARTTELLKRVFGR